MTRAVFGEDEEKSVGEFWWAGGSEAEAPVRSEQIW